MKVYAQWAWVCIAGHCGRGLRQPRGANSPEKARGLGVKTRGAPRQVTVCPGIMKRLVHSGEGKPSERACRTAPRPNFMIPSRNAKLRTHANFTHPTIQPLRKLHHQGTLWRTACGAQRLHSFTNTARLTIRPPTRRAGPRARPPAQVSTSR